MPIIVRELIIRARLDEGRGGQAERPAGDNTGRTEIVNTEEIISLCVEKVIQAIERKKER
jgi:hypothetical protein